MKMQMLPAAVAGLLLLIPLTGNAQKTEVRKADLQFKQHQYYNACATYKKSTVKLRDKNEKSRIYFQIGECYRLMNEWKDAEQWYAKAVKGQYADPNLKFYMAEAKKFNGKYDEAIAAYEEYAKDVSDDPRSKSGIKSVQDAVSWQKESSRWKVQNMKDLNSKEYDFSPAYIDRRHNQLVFTSKREGNNGSTKTDPNTGRQYPDFFVSTVDKNGKWSSPAPLGTGINSEFSEGSCTVSKKCDRMYLTRCDVKKKTDTRCKIYAAVKSGNDWKAETEPIAFGLDAATLDSFSFRHPALSPDEMTLVFASDYRSGNNGPSGSTDLFISSYDKKSKTWGKPVNLGSKINSTGNEVFPYFAEDGTLYFSSDGHAGMGGLDIFKSQHSAGSDWSVPENMRTPFNSSADDFGIIFDGKKERGYLTSNREGTRGEDDIWSFWKEPCPLPLDITVNDTVNKVNVQNASVRLTGSDGSAIEAISDSSGKCHFNLNPEVTYIVNVYGQNARSKKASGYFNLDEKKRPKFSTVDLKECREFSAVCTILPPQDIRLPHIEYDFRSAALRPEAKDSLDYLYRILIDNPTIAIELGSHTDCRGTGPANDKLSQARAESVVKYLVDEKGISKDRLTAKGYGERVPLTLKDGRKLTESFINAVKDEKTREEFHQMNRRTTFRVLRWDYVDPKNPAPSRNIVPPKVTGEEIIGDKED